MRKFTRELSMVDVSDMLNACRQAGELSGVEKTVLAKLTKRMDVEFEDAQENFNERLAKAQTKGVRSIQYNDSDKKKKPIELKHTELSAIAHAFTEVLNDKKTSIDTAGIILRVSDDDTLKLKKYLRENFKESSIKLIDVPEDDAITEPEPEQTEG